MHRVQLTPVVEVAAVEAAAAAAAAAGCGEGAATAGDEEDILGPGEGGGRGDLLFPSFRFFQAVSPTTPPSVLSVSLVCPLGSSPFASQICDNASKCSVKKVLILPLMSS